MSSVMYYCSHDQIGFIKYTSRRLKCLTFSLSTQMCDSDYFLMSSHICCLDEPIRKLHVLVDIKFEFPHPSWQRARYYTNMIMLISMIPCNPATNHNNVIVFNIFSDKLHLLTFQARFHPDRCRPNVVMIHGVILLLMI